MSWETFCLKEGDGFTVGAIVEGKISAAGVSKEEEEEDEDEVDDDEVDEEEEEKDASAFEVSVLRESYHASSDPTILVMHSENLRIKDFFSVTALFIACLI